MNQIKNNIPVILLLVLVPYFFYADASLAQSIIAASLAALCGYKYYLEQKQLLDYKKIFEELGIDRDISGFIRKFAPDDMYEIAARRGVTDFVVPGNKPDRINHYRELIIKCGISEPIFYSPGLVAQGGDITESAKAAGKRFHAIVGRRIYLAKDIRKAACEALIEASTTFRPDQLRIYENAILKENI